MGYIWNSLYYHLNSPVNLKLLKNKVLKKKKKNRASGNCMTIIKDLTTMWSEFLEGKRRREGVKKYLKTQWLKNFQILQENINLQTQTVEQIPNRINSKKSTPTYILTKLLKIKTKKNTESREKWHVTYLGENYLNNSQYFIRNHRGQKKSGTFLGDEKKKMLI